jgi:hypothetical protein
MRTILLALVFGGALAASVAAARPASAQIQCSTDTDCPGATCGSYVCQWTVSGHACVQAGTDLQGYDGWCTIDSNCKCAGQGATCASNSHCTFTVPQDAGSSSTGTSSGSTSSGTGTGNAAGCSTARGAGRGIAPDEGSAVALAGVALAGVALARRRRTAPRRDA